MSGPKLPVDLIVANVAHQILDAVESAEKTANILGGSEQDVAERMSRIRTDATDSFARNLLLSVAQNGSDHAVRKALEALGAPSAENQLWDRLEEARDAQRREEQDDAPSRQELN